MQKPTKRLDRGFLGRRERRSPGRGGWATLRKGQCSLSLNLDGGDSACLGKSWAKERCE